MSRGDKSTKDMIFRSFLFRDMEAWLEAIKEILINGKCFFSQLFSLLIMFLCWYLQIYDFSGVGNGRKRKKPLLIDNLMGLVAFLTLF